MIWELIGAIISLLGAIFLLLASIGINRMPDTYTRILSASKASTLGTLLFIMGIAFRYAEWIPRLILLFLMVLFTAPLSAHIIARTAYYLGIPLSSKTIKNELKRK